MDLNPPPIAFYGSLWEALPDTSAIKRWAAELKAAPTNGKTLDPWGEIGQAVIIEHADTAEVAALMPEIARFAGLYLTMMEIDGVDVPFEALNGEEPALVFLQPGEWLGGALGDDAVLFDRTRNPNFDPRAAHGFRRALAQALEAALSGRLVVFVVAVEDHAQLDPALRRRGLFDRKLCLPKLTPEVHAGIFLADVGRHRFAREVLEQPVRLGTILTNGYSCSRRRGLLAAALTRRYERSGMAIGFRDLVECAVYGTAEEDGAPPMNDMDYWAIAVHEAGHVLVAHLDSRDKVIPAYCTVLPRGSTLGLMSQPADAHASLTPNSRVRDLRHSIRVDLAGRAAEVLVLGPEEVSARGAREDLQSATDDAMSMFGAWGVPADTTLEAAGSNLAALARRPSEGDRLRVEGMSRQYLAKEFAAVTAMLEQNHATLIAIAEALVARKVLVSADMERLLPRCC